MTASAFEMGRLAVLQRAPLHFVERRVEALDLADDYHYRVEVSQQFVVPRHGENASGPASDRELLVPLGQFTKDRMPDLEVEGQDGSTLPLLSRSERGEVGATLFTAEWSSVFFKGLPKSTMVEAEEVWSTIWQLVAGVIAGAKREAEIKLAALEDVLEEWSATERYSEQVQLKVLQLLGTKQFWDDLYALAETRLLVAKMQGVPGRTYTLKVRYTERFEYRGHAKSSIGGVMRQFLAWLGLISLPIARRVTNVGQAASLWVVQSVPDGLEALRCYWKADRNSNVSPDPVSVEVTRAVAGRHAVPVKSPVPIRNPDEDFLLLDVQIAPSTALLGAMGLALLLLFVSTYVYQAIPAVNVSGSGSGRHVLVSLETFTDVGSRSFDENDRALFVGLGSVFAAVPAAVAGALAYRGRTFTRRASRGPRALLAILSVEAAFFAVVVSLKDLGDLAEATAYVLSVSCLWVFGVFALIQFGPRWRKNDMSRKKSATSKASPIECRVKQIRDVVACLGAWTLFVVVFARCQAVLQEKHFFTADFPVNIWHAWWSIF